MDPTFVLADDVTVMLPRVIDLDNGPGPACSSFRDACSRLPVARFLGRRRRDIDRRNAFVREAMSGLGIRSDKIAYAKKGEKRNL